MACTSCKNKMAGTKKGKSKVGATKKRRSTRRKSKIKGFESISLEKVLGAIAGGYAVSMGKKYLNDPANEITFVKDNPMIVDAVLLAGGAYLTTMDGIVEGAGYGIVAKVGADLIEGFMAGDATAGVGGVSTGNNPGNENYTPDFIYGTDNNGNQIPLQLNRGTGNYEPINVAGNSTTDGQNRVVIKTHGGL